MKVCGRTQRHQEDNCSTACIAEARHALFTGSRRKIPLYQIVHSNDASPSVHAEFFVAGGGHIRTGYNMNIDADGSVDCPS